MKDDFERLALPQQIPVESWGEDTKGAFERFLSCSRVLVMVNPSAPGVVLPPHLTVGHDAIMLDYNLDAVIPIHDLEATDQGISATLSFSREPHKTFVPWAAVLIMAANPRPVERSRERPKLKLV